MFCHDGWYKLLIFQTVFALVNVAFEKSQLIWNIYLLYPSGVLFCNREMKRRHNMQIVRIQIRMYINIQYNYWLEEIYCTNGTVTWRRIFHLSWKKERERRCCCYCCCCDFKCLIFTGSVCRSQLPNGDCHNDDWNGKARMNGTRRADPATISTATRGGHCFASCATSFVFHTLRSAQCRCGSFHGGFLALRHNRSCAKGWNALECFA